MNYYRIKNHQRGAVSLFVVVFTALLVIIVTVGFVQLMIRNQQQATQSDLSQSAYDSALAGVEDAKRAMVIAKKCANDSAPPICQNIEAKLDSESCSTLSTIFEGSADSEERKIQQTVSDESLDQAYTCVKVIQNTPDYTRKGLQPGKSHFIPLRVATGESFDQVEIKWFTREDISEDFNGDNTLPIDESTTSFPPAGSDAWPTSAPSLLRAQLIKTDGSFSLLGLEATGGSNNVRTLFLYPSIIGNNIPTSADPGFEGPLHSAPQKVKCNNDKFSEGDYACTATIMLPSPTTSGYLRLSAFYNKTRYRVVMKNGDTVVKFHGVQPEVDSTGRANDLFRRVKARVQFESTDFPYPEDALDLYGSLCKDFSVTNIAAHYSPGRCNVEDIEP
jgi:hypothetical protein